MIRAHLFAVDPTAEQEQQFRSHCWAQRVAYNWALAQVMAHWDPEQGPRSPMGSPTGCRGSRSTE
ncbi:helix-turn-helix domain-containing protein [Rhodococcus ruber]|uniref:helix-turn-helix domain-containing protein n=1 Tax=Rhodococcus ruber TaxID=1830 RepID=UPI00315C7B11